MTVTAVTKAWTRMRQKPGMSLKNVNMEETAYGT